MIQLIICTIIFALLKAWKEYVIIEKNKVGHIQNFFIASFFCFSAIYLKLYFENCGFGWLMVGCIAPYWWTYDIGLNIMRGKPITYSGDGSFFDRLGWINWFVLKPIALFFTICITIEYYKYL